MKRMNACFGSMGAGIGVFFLGTAMTLAGQKQVAPVPADAGQQQAPASNQPAATSASTAQASPANAAAAAVPDHAASYYHFMLARRYSELAGIYNSSDYVDKAISEFKQAIQEDPDSLFLKVQLAELYSRISRMDEAMKLVQDVLKVNPKDLDAHRLLARIYLNSLGETQPGSATGTPGGQQAMQETLNKAIHEFEQVTTLDPKDMQSAFLLGRLYGMNHQPAKAAEEFQRILGSNPDSRPAIVQLAELDSDQGQYRDAITLLKKIPDDEMDSGLLLTLGDAYANVGENGSAQAAYKKALKLDPENDTIRRHYAEALIAGGNNDEARAQLQAAVKADPQDSESYVRLAQLDRREGKFADAQKDLDQAKALAPDSNRLSYEQAALDEVMGKNDDAISVVNQWLTRTAKPDGQYTEPEAYDRSLFLQFLGGIYSSEQKYDQALDTFKQIVALGGDQVATGEGLIADTLRAKHEPEQALKVLDSAIEKFPKNNSLRIGRATLLGQQGKVQEAISQLQALLTNSPTDQQIYLDMANVYLGARQYPAAEAVVKKALALIPDPADQDFARFMLGSVYEREKKYDLAEQEFKQVLQQDPFNGAAANYLGYEMANRGVQLKESLGYIQQAVKLEPNNGAYLDSLGWVYYKMKRYNQAEGPLEKAAQLISDDPTIRMHLGYVYLSLGKRNLAMQEWELALKLWPKAQASDFGPPDAAKLRKQLDHLKVEMARGKKNSAANN